MFVGEDQITCLLLGTDVKMKPFNIDDFTAIKSVYRSHYVV